MSQTGTSTELPPDLQVALSGFTVLGALLVCADPKKWSSLARPPADELGRLVLSLTERLNTGIEALGIDLPL